MKNCIFCMIVKGEIPSLKIFEDKNHIAILDINPNCKGSTLVIPKKHYSSKVFEMEDGNYKSLMLSTKKVASILMKGLNVERVGMGMDGTGVDHAHIKLYPMYIPKDDLEVSDDRVYFKKYPGYITTQLGPSASIEELKKIQATIIDHQ